MGRIKNNNNHRANGHANFWLSRRSVRNYWTLKGIRRYGHFAANCFNVFSCNRRAVIKFWLHVKKNNKKSYNNSSTEKSQTQKSRSCWTNNIICRHAIPSVLVITPICFLFCQTNRNWPLKHFIFGSLQMIAAIVEFITCKLPL